ncbi:hypothetical protein ACFL34_02560, partial [Candidatus Sumerlaeota bacterium]
DLMNLPSCPLEARVLLVHEHAADRARAAVEYIKNKYPQSDAFQEARGFVDHDLIFCMRGDFKSLSRVWLFPASEASEELSECRNRLLDCSYKASRDNMRRALELILVGAFFSNSHISPKDAQCWLNSTRDTPHFSRAVKDLSVLPRFERFNAAHKWADVIKAFYWGPSDTTHTKGQKHSLREIQPVQATINTIRIPQFNEEALRGSLDLYLQTVSHIAVILALYNPVLLVGLPLLQKFVDNGPASGFFEEPQAETLWGLIPADYHPSLRHIVETDEEVRSVMEWVEGLPDQF